jgi:large subunit ribosomal protein L28
MPTTRPGVVSCPIFRKRSFGPPALGRFIRLRISAAGLKNINKLGIDAVLADMRARGEKY